MLTLVDGSILHVTDSSGLDDVGHLDTLDGLVLGDSTGAVTASKEANGSTSLQRLKRNERDQEPRETAM
jgi:hypothetical protein